MYYMLYSNPYALIGYVLVLIGMVFMIYAQSKVSSNYKKYSSVKSSINATGYQVAREILDSRGLQNVQVYEVKGTMSDHYNPKTKSVHLSTAVYSGTSIASLSIAAHECGHALQHHEGYQPLIFRNTVLPLAKIGQSLGWVAVFIGLIFSMANIAWVGVILMTGILLFQVATLPVEFDASSRALEILRTNYLTPQENDGAKSMLSAAALTYVAAMVATLFSLLRIVLLIMGNSRD